MMSDLDKKDLLKKLAQSYEEIGGINHIHGPNLPSRERVFSIMKLMREILFPGYFEEEELHHDAIEETLDRKLTTLDKRLATEIIKSSPSFTKDIAIAISTEFLKNIPSLRAILKKDVDAVFDGDPAASSHDEIILAYPGFQAISIYRQAHILSTLGVPIIPRLMTEISHSMTGIDIHPAATIGDYFCIDHGTGVVIGETAVIGEHVKLYQGVTIGALSVSKEMPERKAKRHPTLEDHVTVYSGTTILGGDTVIGEGAVIGGNLWITDSVPKQSKMYLTGDLKQVLKSSKEKEDE